MEAPKAWYATREALEKEEGVEVEREHQKRVKRWGLAFHP